jgi:hypothetical protein
MQNKLDHAMKEVTDKYMILEEAEKTAVRTALIEERGRFCLFISCLRPFVVRITLDKILNWKTSTPPKKRLIDWCLMPTLAVFQLYCGVIKFKKKEKRN